MGLISQQPAPKCVCGAELELRQARKAYKLLALGAECDICGDRMRGKTACWHCPMKSSWAHPVGFDVCNRCAHAANDNLGTRMTNMVKVCWSRLNRSSSSELPPEGAYSESEIEFDDPEVV